MRTVISVEAETGTLQSLVAEHCRATGTLTVTAVPAEDRRCSAALHGQEGERLRRLIVDSSGGADGVSVAPGAAVSWSVPGADLRAGISVRVTCTLSPNRDGD